MNEFHDLNLVPLRTFSCASKTQEWPGTGGRLEAGEMRDWERAGTAPCKLCDKTLQGMSCSDIFLLKRAGVKCSAPALQMLRGHKGETKGWFFSESIE